MRLWGLLALVDHLIPQGLLLNGLVEPPQSGFPIEHGWVAPLSSGRPIEP